MVEDEPAERLPVEAVPLLDAECGVEVEGQLEESGEDAQDPEEGEAGGDRAEAQGSRRPSCRGLDEAEAAPGDEGEADDHLGPAVDEAEAVPVARVRDRFRHLALADAEGPARLGEAGGVDGVPPVQARERGLGGLLRQAEDDEDEEEGHPSWAAIGEAEGRIRCATISISIWPAW